MERYFYRLGEKVPVNEIEGVVAVKLPAEGEKILPVGDSDLGEIATRGDFEQPFIRLNEEENQALSEAGWIFLRPSSRMAEVLDDNSLPDEVEEVSEVYQEEDGHVLIGTDRLTVQFDSGLDSEQVEERIEEMNLSIVRELKFAPNQYELAIPSGGDLLEIANTLQESEDTVYAEPTFIEYVGQRLKPTDVDYGRQWHLNNDGSNGGVTGADISAENAWDHTLGENVRLAVIDNGFDINHEDLSAGIVNESGYFENSGNFRQTLNNFPDSNHGTFCAGMAAARHNNGKGGCGSAPKAELILVATLNDQVGTQATLARAVAYAANPIMEVATADPTKGADVISCSLGPNGANWALTSILQNAILFATNQGRNGLGTPIFWASSNGNNVDIALDKVVSHPNVIAVGRSRDDDKEDDSARGDELDFLAPGVDVFSTRSGNIYGISTGTSFAAPLAAGIGALILSVNPNLTWREVRQIMRDTCDKVGGVSYDSSGHNDDYGFGRVNARKAVVKAKP